jgi:hypothetical protein
MAQRAKTRQGSGVSLKKQILEWWAALPEPTTRAVADLVGCGTEYVRVVVRQRRGNGVSDIDRRYDERLIARTGRNRHAHYYENNKDAHKARVERYLVQNFGSLQAGYKHFNDIARAKRAKERL